MITVALRIPLPMKESLLRNARLRQMSGYQALMRLYCEEGIRQDEERLSWSAMIRVTEALKQRGVPEDILDDALQSVVSSMPYSGF